MANQEQFNNIVRIIVDNSQAEPALDSINQSLETMEDNVQDVNKKFEETGEAVDKVTGKLEDAANKTREVSNEANSGVPKVNGLGRAFEQVFDIVNKEGGKAGANLGQMFQSLKDAIPVVRNLNSTALKGLTGIKAALASLGIGAIVTAIGFLVSKLVEWVKQTRELKKAQKDLNDEIRKGAAGAAEQVVKLTQLSEKYRQLGDDAKAKEKFLKDYRKEIEKVGIAVNDVNTADDVFINKTDDYRTALMRRATAAAAYELAVQKTKEYLEKLPELEEDLAKATAKAEKDLENLSGRTFPYSNMLPESPEEFESVQKRKKALQEFKDNYQKTLKQLLEINQEFSDSLIGGSGGSGGSGGGKKKETPYDKWVKNHLDAVINGEIALNRWEKLLAREGELRKELERLRKIPVEEVEVEEESPKDYLTKLQKRREAAIDYQKELLDIEVLSAREKNNILYELEMERLDSEGEYLRQMRDLTLEDTQEREELDQKIEENEQQKEILRRKRVTQRKKDLADEVVAYAQAAQSIADVFGIVAEAQEDSIRRRLKNNKISEEQAEEEFERVKGYQIAQTWINTLAGMTAAIASVQGAGPAGWIAGAAQAAALLASGIAQTAKIRNTRFNEGSGGASVPSVGVTPVQVVEDIQPSPSTLPESQSPTDQRVYILQSDLEESHRQVEVREANSSF